MIVSIELFSANVHLEDQFKWTALHHAASSGQLGVVQALINAGAKINHESLTSATPLSRAIESSAIDVVNYLLQNRANVRHENLTRMSAVFLMENHIFHSFQNGISWIWLPTLLHHKYSMLFERPMKLRANKRGINGPLIVADRQQIRRKIRTSIQYIHCSMRIYIHLFGFSHRWRLNQSSLNLPYHVGARCWLLRKKYFHPMIDSNLLLIIH